jgi:acyl carrier protein
MNKEEIKTLIIQTLKSIAPETEPDKISESDDIRYTLGIDSFDFLQFIIAIDEKLNIAIPEEDYGKLFSIGSLIEYLMAKNNIQS